MSKGPYTPAPSYRTNHIQKYVNHRSAYDLSTTSDIADVSLSGRRVMVIRKLAEVPKGATCQLPQPKGLGLVAPGAKLRGNIRLIDFSPI